MKTKISDNLFERAKNVIPGGVNSPVRAFKNVGCNPRFIKSSCGAYLFDEDGNKYVDYIDSWGPMILGHQKKEIVDAVKKEIENGLSYGAATRLEVEIAEFICKNISWIEMIRMVNSGTEAVMSAIRAARGYTGREKIVKFAGCYHGHSDSLLVKAGSGAMTTGVPDSLGVPKNLTKDTLTAAYNDLKSVKNIFENYGESIACVIVEPVAANMGVICPNDGFLEGLRNLCDKYGSILIFDEVITGFRLTFEGAAGYFNVTPDLVTYGKIIGGGMPVGAYGGKREIMEMVSPCGKVYQAGTLSGNPVAMAAGLAQLKYLYSHPEVYSNIENLGTMLRDGLKKIISKNNIPATVNGIGSLSCLYFNKGPVENYEDALKSDTKLFAGYFKHMLDKGFYFGPSQFEAVFISNAHTKEIIENTLDCADKWFSESSNI